MLAFLEKLQIISIDCKYSPNCSYFFFKKNVHHKLMRAWGCFHARSRTGAVGDLGWRQTKGREVCWQRQTGASDRGSREREEMCSVAKEGAGSKIGCGRNQKEPILFSNCRFLSYDMNIYMMEKIIAITVFFTLIPCQQMTSVCCWVYSQYY